MSAEHGEPISTWELRVIGVDDSQEPAMASVLSVANGAIAVRGWLEEDALTAGPGTFFAGTFDAGDERKRDPPPAMVAAPSWFAMAWTLDGEPLSRVSVERVLDMKRGIVERRSLLLSPSGRRVTLV